MLGRFLSIAQQVDQPPFKPDAEQVAQLISLSVQVAREIIMISMFKSAVLISGLLATTACITDPNTGNRRVSKAAIGGVGGAAAGLLLGDLLGGRNDRTEKIVGAGIGAIAGAGIGAYMDAQEKKLRAQTAGTDVQVTRDRPAPAPATPPRSAADPLGASTQGTVPALVVRGRFTCPRALACFSNRRSSAASSTCSIEAPRMECESPSREVSNF